MKTPGPFNSKLGTLPKPEEFKNVSLTKRQIGAGASSLPKPEQFKTNAFSDAGQQKTAPSLTSEPDLSFSQYRDSGTKLSELEQQLHTFETDGMTELNKKVDALRSKYKGANLANVYTRTGNIRSGKNVSQAVADGERQIRQLNSEYRQKLTKLKKDVSDAQKQSKADAAYNRYVDVTKKADFEEKSAYVPAKKKTDEELKAEGYKKAASGEWYREYGAATAEYYTGENDKRYDYINDPGARQTLEVNEIQAVNNAYTQKDTTYRKQGLDQLTDTEKKIYNYIYNTSGKKDAEEFLKFIDDELVSRAAAKESERYAELADKAPVLASAVSVYTNMASGMAEYPARLMAAALGENAEYFNSYGRATSAIRGKVGEKADEALGNAQIPVLGKPLGSTAYGLTMSIADFIAASKVAKATGATDKGVQAIAQIIMSSEAGNSTLTTSLENGDSPAKAVLLSVGSAGIEALTEKYSIEALMSDPATAGKYFVKNVVTEASEEGASDLANYVWDEIVSRVDGSESEIMRDYNELVSNGASKKEAATKVLVSRLQDVGADVLGGGISGGAVSAPGAVNAAYQNAKQKHTVYRNTEQTLSNVTSDKKIVKGASKIVGQSLRSVAANSRVTKQSMLDGMTKQGYTPSAAFTDALEETAGVTDVNDSGLSEKVRDNVSKLTDKLDTEFAAAWYKDSSTGAAADAAAAYAKGAAAGKTVGAVIATRRAVADYESNKISEKKANSRIKKAASKLQSGEWIDLDYGSVQDRAGRVIASAEAYIVGLNENTADYSQNYLEDAVQLIGAATAATNANMSADSKRALSNLIVNGDVSTDTVERILSDAAATQALSYALGADITAETRVSDVLRKARNMISVMKSGNSAAYQSAQATKHSRVQLLQAQLARAGVADETVLQGIRNAVYNGELTDRQAKAIATDPAAFDIFARATGSKLGAESTVEDMKRVAGLVAGFDFSAGTDNQYYDAQYSGTEEVTGVFAAGVSGAYDPETGKLLVEQSASEKEKAARVAANEIVRSDGDVAEYDLTAHSDTGVFFKPWNEYSTGEKTIIRNYINSVDGALKDDIDKAEKSKDYFKRSKIGEMTKKVCFELKELLGVDVNGYTHNISSDEIRHIFKRHGKNGKHDHTMRANADIARALFVLDNYDKLEVIHKNNDVDSSIEYASKFMDKNNTPAILVRYSKKINSTYYVVETAMENSRQKNWVISAYMKNDSTSKELDAFAPSTTSKTSLSAVESNNIINDHDTKSQEKLSIADAVLSYIDEHYGDYDERAVRAAKKYDGVVRKDQYKLNGPALSAENIRLEVAADFLQETFLSDELMNKLVDEDLDLAVELAERVNGLRTDPAYSDYKNGISEIYRDLFSKISEDERSLEFDAVVGRRRDAGESLNVVDTQNDTFFHEMDENEQSFMERAADHFNALKRGFVDSGEAITRFGKAVKDERFTHFYNNAKQARNTSNTMLTKNNVSFEGRTVGKSLQDIFKPLLKNKAKYRDFNTYLRLLDNSERGRSQDHFGRLKRNKAVLYESGLPLSPEESLKRAEDILRRNPEFSKYRDEVYAYEDNLLDWLLKSELISQETIDEFKAKNKYYVPEFEIGRSSGAFFADDIMISKVVKKAKGGDILTIPVMNAIALQTEKVVRMARQNVLVKEMIYKLQDMGLITETPLGFEVADSALSKFINHVTATKNTDSTLGEMKNGVYITRGARGKLVTEINQLFEYPDGSKNEARALIREFADKVTLNESMDVSDVNELVDKLTELAYVQEETLRAPYYQYEDLRRMLRGTKLYVPAEVAHDFPDYDAFRKSLTGRLVLTGQQTDGVSFIDSFYEEELASNYPELFNPNITNAADQLDTIRHVLVDVLAKPDPVTMAEYYKETLPDVKAEIADEIKRAALTAVKEAHTEREQIKAEAEKNSFVRLDPEKLDVTTDEPMGNRMAFYLEGVRHTADIGQDFYEGLRQIEYVPPANKAFIAAKALNNTFKKLVTSWNPFFSIRNFLRDFQDAILYSQDTKAFLRNFPKAYKEIVTHGALWTEYVNLGGLGDSYFNFDESVRIEEKEPNLLKRGVKRAVELAEAINMTVEQAPRLAEYMAVRSKGDGSYVSKMKALYAAADVTVNFGRSGIYSKFINATFVPFFNPGVQGASKFVRLFTETKGVKQWLLLAFKLAALGFSFGGINELLHYAAKLIWDDDDEGYDQLTDYTKQNNILFRIGKDNYLKLPKGRGVNVFSIGVMNAIDAARGKDVSWLGYIQTAVDQIAPNNPLTENIAAPIILATMNRTWYGSTIENKSDENVKPALRYDENTDYISRFLGEQLGMSPKKIHYVLDAYSGVLGDYLLPLLTPKDKGDPLAVLGRLAKGNFVVDSTTSNRISSDYYSLIDNLKHEKTDLDIEDPTAAAVAFQFMNSQTQIISPLYDEIHNVNGGKLKPGEKAEQSKQLKATINTVMLNAIANEENVYELAAKIKTKRAVKKNNGFYNEAGEELTYEKYVDTIYRETCRELFGAEYALNIAGSEIYAKAAEAVDNGATFDLYYDAYYDLKNIEGDIDVEKGKIVTGSERKNKWKYIREMDASRTEKAALAQTLLDVSPDKINDAISVGLSAYEYVDFLCNTGSLKSDASGAKRDKVLEYINSMQISSRQKDALYRLSGYSEKTIGSAPWR